ncbi:unnamed protein product [Lactuca virosa]|uniref:Uncharacterized protein n=1 Tax=Lactuca virosa TaxID=75947 RepID=A0AAU9PNW5_9ASTR|nr:unnamed protein product [Lactuca virosa]
MFPFPQTFTSFSDDHCNILTREPILPTIISQHILPKTRGELKEVVRSVNRLPDDKEERVRWFSTRG